MQSKIKRWGRCDFGGCERIACCHVAGLSMQGCAIVDPREMCLEHATWYVRDICPGTRFLLPPVMSL